MRRARPIPVVPGLFKARWGPFRPAMLRGSGSQSFRRRPGRQKGAGGAPPVSVNSTQPAARAFGPAVAGDIGCHHSISGENPPEVRHGLYRQRGAPVRPGKRCEVCPAGFLRHLRNHQKHCGHGGGAARAFESGITFDASLSGASQGQRNPTCCSSPIPPPWPCCPGVPSRDGLARFFCSVRYPDGRPFEGDARAVWPPPRRNCATPAPPGRWDGLRILSV